MPFVDKLRWLWQKLLPSPCLWCSLPVQQHQELLCSECQGALPQLPYQLCHYNLLWLPAVSAGLPKAHFDRLLSLGWYQLPYQHWIRRWKFHGDLFAARLLQQQFQALLLRYQQAGQPLPAAIVYVPMTPKKERKRGFNQAKILAECVATQLGIPLLDVLQRRKETASQVGLNRLQRQQNLAGAFSLATVQLLPAHVALVDDVVTTGTTANQLAIILKQHGVTQLSLWTLAVTPNADHSSA
ncbi:competence protein F [Alishewanella longhuensis]|uniref:Competence protein F n=1 Tax=Alishewanella longhuensis TaxID=1091037 RepID=A0ABQ3L1H2_9ALTE|nr:ComF family protein [Alishewanella longhuensis]GHG75469.1 competence protein F [Alishewanella longhuensis]